MITLIRNCHFSQFSNVFVAGKTSSFRAVSVITTANSQVKFQRYSYTTLPVPWPWLELDEICRTSKVPEKFNFATNVFDRYASLTPSKLALWVENETNDQQWTFEQFKTESTRTALALRNALLESHPNINLNNSLIFVLLPKVPEWWSIYLASIRLGLIFCPGTVQLSASDIAYRLQTSSAKIIITNYENVEKIEEAQRLNETEGHSTEIPPVKIVVPSNIPGVEEDQKSILKSKDKWHNYHQLMSVISEPDIQAFKNVETNSDAVAQVFFTSGTTGKPKMVAHSHSSYGIGHYTTAKVYGLSAIDILWTLADPGWAKSSYGNFFAPWVVGAGIYIHQMERFDTRKVLEALCKRPITKFCAPPTFFRSIVQEKDPALFKFHSLQTCVSGGEAVNEEVIRNWQKLTGKKIDLREIYGQTETTATAGYGHDEKRVEQSLGKPVQGFDLRIVDNNGNELPQDTEGNLAIKVKPTRPVGLFKGYMTKITSAGQLVFDNSHSSFVGDYYLTGDLATRDKDDYFYFVGRSDDVIISAGYRIGPFELEECLMKHPAVAENAVVPTPNTLRGSVVKAFIVLSEEYKYQDKEILIKEIQQHCKIQTAPYKYPREIEFIDSLPKTFSGKILRRELRRKEMAKA